MDIIFLFSVILFIAYLALGIYTISRNPRSGLNRVFLALIACTVLWLGADIVLFASNYESWFWFKVASIGWISLPLFCVYFALVLTGRMYSLAKWKTLLLAFPTVLEIILMFTVVQPPILADISRYFLTDYVASRSEWFWYLHVPYYLIYSIMTLIIVARWGHDSVFRREKRQAGTIFWFSLMLLISFLLQYSVLPVFGLVLPWLVIFAGLVWLIAILFAINKYKLMDLHNILDLEDILFRSTDIIMVINRSNNIALANNKALEILAYSLKELQTLPLNKIIPAAETDSLLQLHDSTMESEVRMQTSRGELVPVKIYCTPIVDRFLDIHGILLIGQDLRLPKQLEEKIEKMQQVESALRESEAKYRNIFENAYDLIYMHDVNGRYISVNRATEKLLGYSQEELSHMNALSFVVREQRQNIIDLFQEKMSEHQPVYYEVTVINRNGIEYHLNVSRQLIFETPEATVYQCIARDITDRKQMEERLEYLSMHDSMTDLYNRAYFTEELKRMESGRFEPSSIIICDLDYLKSVNDNYGHVAGDEMIVTAARLIKSCFRCNDVVARFGGDEFAIVIPKGNETICLNLVEKIQTAIAQHNQTSPFPISISIGYATRTSFHQTMQDVLQQADQAMYADKARRKKMRS